VTPVVECSSSKHKALSLNLTAKINKYIKHYGNRFGSKCLMQELGRELGNLLAENNGLDFFFFHVLLELHRDVYQSSYNIS
jgi:hypothetical protein